MPCLNEDGNITAVVTDVLSRLDNLERAAELILIDDGSSDATWEHISEQAAADDRVRGIRQMRNYGQSLAYQAGIEEATGELIIFYSADQEVSASHLEKVVEKLDEGWDFVNTKRTGRWSGNQRAMLSDLGNKVTNLISGLKIDDRGSGLKGMDAKLAKTLRFYGEMHRFIPDYVSLHTDRIIEIETDFRDRTYGDSAYRGRKRSLSVFLDLITLAFLVHSGRRPFMLSPGRVFAFTGLIIGSAGFAVASWLSLDKVLFGATLSDRPLFLIAVLGTILGVMMIMMGVNGEMVMRAYYESGARRTHLLRERVGAVAKADIDRE